MFATGTVGIVLGGPLAILIFSWLNPEIVGGAGADAVWRGLTTVAGRWIGGGANFVAIGEAAEVTDEMLGLMVIVDVFVASIWMGVLLYLSGHQRRIDGWTRANTKAIDELTERITEFQERVMRVPTLPDLLMIDGGKGQLGVLRAAVADAGLEVEAISLAKERDEESPGPRVRRSGGLKAERVFLPNRKDPVQLSPSAKGLLLLQRVRDESHRFAIEFQRQLRSKVNFTSILEELPGIGPTKRRALLRHLGSLRAIRSASEETLRAVPGVSERDANTLRSFFDAVEPDAAEADAVEPDAAERTATESDGGSEASEGDGQAE